MARKRILFIQSYSRFYPLDEKIKLVLPYLREHISTYVETLRTSAATNHGRDGQNSLSLKVRGKLLLSAVKYDLVYVRNILDVPFLHALRLANDHLILELSQPSGTSLDLFVSSNDRKKMKLRRAVEKAAKTAKVLLVDGEHQAKILRKFNRNVSVCPPVFPESPHPPEGVSRKVKAIGFAGTGDNRNALRSIETSLKAISIRYPHIYTIVTSDSFFLLNPPIQYLYRKMIPETPADIFSDMDIFIFPAERMRDEFYGNSLFVLHALAAGIPCIVWHTEIDRGIFRDGEDVLIATSGDEFSEKLALLIEDHDLRRKLAEKGFDRARTYFNPEVAATFYLQSFRKILDAR